MATAQTTPSRLRRFFGWFARHKVTAVFVVLVLAGVLYFAVSDVVWRVQVRSERGQYMHLQDSLASITSGVSDQVARPTTTKQVPSCGYTSVEFGRGSLSCDVDVYSSYSAKDKQEARLLSQRITAHIAKIYTMSLGRNPATDENNIATYDLALGNGKIGCFVDYWYFSNGTPPFSVEDYKLNTNTGLFAQFNCGGSARVEYFPVTNN